MLTSGPDSAHLPPRAAIRSAAAKAVRGKRRLGTAAAFATLALAVAAPAAAGAKSRRSAPPWSRGTDQEREIAGERGGTDP